MKKELLLAIPFILTSCANSNKEIAHIVFLMGQSNAAGCSWNFCLKNHFEQAKIDEYTNGYENVLIDFECDGTSNSSWGKFVTTKLGQGKNSNRFGPEIGMAEYISNHHEGNVYIIKCAWGGTSIAVNWKSPSISHGLVGNMYESFQEMSNKAFKTLNEMGLKPQVDAICWFQGEQDSTDCEYTRMYGNYLSLMVKDMRDELKDYARSGGIGFIDVAIGSVWERHNEINSYKKAFANNSDINDYVDAEDYSYSLEPSLEDVDNDHMDSNDMIKVGNDIGKILCEKYL